MIRNILIVDDEQAIHDSFSYCLTPKQIRNDELDELAALMFGPEDGDDQNSEDAPQSKSANAAQLPTFQLEHAYQGEEAIELLTQRIERGSSYHLAFVDVRMPPGLNGVETSRKLRALDPELTIVICTAYSDVDWDGIRATMPNPDKLHLLRKPFEPERVRTLAAELTT